MPKGLLILLLPRLFLGATLLALPVVAGYIYRSPWIIALLAVATLLVFWAERRARFAQMRRDAGPDAMVRTLLGYLLGQAAIIGVFYFIGRGIGAVLGASDPAPLSNGDVIVALISAALGVAIVLILERVTPIPVPQTPVAKAAGGKRKKKDGP